MALAPSSKEVLIIITRGRDKEMTDAGDEESGLDVEAGIFSWAGALVHRRNASVHGRIVSWSEAGSLQHTGRGLMMM